MRLLVISHVIHYQHNSQLYAYGPYTREIDIWADLFPEVVIAAPCRNEAPPKDALPFTRSNISVSSIVETGGDTLKDKLVQVLSLPILIWGLCRAMQKADAIHVRSPGNVGLLGAVFAPLFSRYLVAKYAGQWNGYEGERLAVRLQRTLLSSSWWKGPVTVYGQWPDQPAHVVPFFTSMMSSEQVERAIETAHQKVISSPLRVLFSGRLEPEKRVHALLDAVKIAVESGVNLEVTIVGDGSEKHNLLNQVAQLGIQENVKFVGALPFEDALKWCEWAHCLVLPSVDSEGWPKVIAEGMCYGLICVAVEHGQIPAMLKGRGILLKRGTPQEIADALISVAQNPEEYQAIMQKASLWSRQYSLEGLRDAIAELLTERWNVPLRRLNAQPVNNRS